MTHLCDTCAVLPLGGDSAHYFSSSVIYFSSHHPSLSLLLFTLNITYTPSTLSHPLSLSFITVSCVSERLTRHLLLLLFLLSLSPSCEGLIDRSGFCQHRRGTLNFKPSDVDPSPLRHCDLSPFTLPPKQTGHDPPPESRSHSSLGTRREESDADGNQFFFFSPQSCFSESSFL